MWTRLGMAMVVGAACGREPPSTVAATLASTPPSTTATISTPAPIEAPAYPPGIASLRLRRSIVVRFAPDEAAKNIGTAVAGTRVGWKRAASGPGCPRWIEILPRGWICDRYLEPSVKPPRGAELPELAEGELVPGVYGKVVGTGATVRRVAEVVRGGRTYWKTLEGKLLDARKIRVHDPSTFAGVRLEGRALPIAWAQSRKRLKDPVAVRGGPHAAAPVIDELVPRTVVEIEEELGGWMRIGGARWVAAADLHVVRAGEPPEDLAGADEKWLDVDLDEQVVVAHEGTRAVFATLVSSGSRKWPTPSGIYRVWLKFAETTMSGQMGDEQPYSVATVPWTMFFAKDFAFHTSYWHDRFGEARSHGCLNLSPRDARTLYEWTSPDVPAGWSMVHGYRERPGSLIKIHSDAAPAVEYRGYARAVREAPSTPAGAARRPPLRMSGGATP